VLEQTQGIHLHAKFHLNVFIVSASGGQKPQFWANFILTFGVLLYRPPITYEVCYSRPVEYVYLRNFVSIILFCRPVSAKNPNFYRFLDFGI